MKHQHLNILLTSAGRRVGLLQAFRESADSLGIQATIVASDLNPEMSAACRFADKRIQAPRSTSPEYQSFLKELAQSLAPVLIVPCIDPDIYFVSTLESASDGIYASCSSVDAIAVCRNKQATAAVLLAAGVPTPKTSLVSKAEAEELVFDSDVVLKPIDGSAGKGIIYLKAGYSIHTHALGESTYIAQEWLNGQEFTVNVFVDRLGSVKSVVPHQRLAVRAGEVEKGHTVRLKGIDEIANHIVNALPGLKGPICFQCFAQDGDVKGVFEINARFGGGYPLAHKAGATFTKWLLEEVQGIDPSTASGWTEGLTMIRYDEALYF